MPDPVPIRMRARSYSHLLVMSLEPTIRVDGNQHWAGKARSLSNGRWLKRALGAALNLDRSSHLLCLGRMPGVKDELKHQQLRQSP